MNLVCLPVLVPMATAVLAMSLRHRPRAAIAATLAGNLLLLAIAGDLARRAAWGGEILTLPLGDWGTHLGIVWVVDGLASIMVALAAIIGLATLVYAPKGLRHPRESPFFYPLHQIQVGAVIGCFITGDLFNLFVFFEVMLMASYVQITLGARPGQLTRTFPYVLINFVSGLLFLAGVGVMYATSGTVSMAELSDRIASEGLPPPFWGGLGIVLCVFALKTALVPLFFWLPDAYPESPIPINAMLGGLLTKVGVYTLYRGVTLFIGPEPAGFYTLLAGISAATMLFGVLGALGRDNIRQILSFHIISQVGYMTFGLSLNSRVGLAAGIFYVVHHVIVKSGLFLAGGVVERIGGSDRLKEVRGVGATLPWAAAGFFVPAMALAGIPPFSGFWGKLFLLIDGYRSGYWVTATTAVVVSLLTLASMLKIWEAAYWGEPRGQHSPGLGRDPGMMAGVLGLAGLSIAIGLLAAPIFDCCERVSAQLLEVRPYVEAVLEAGRGGMGGESS